MRLSPELLISLWDRAKAAEIGIAIVTDGTNINSLNMQLHNTRKQLNEPELYDLAIVLPEGGKEIWLVKKGTELDD